MFIFEHKNRSKFPSRNNLDLKALLFNPGHRALDRLFSYLTHYNYALSRPLLAPEEQAKQPEILFVRHS